MMLESRSIRDRFSIVAAAATAAAAACRLRPSLSLSLFNQASADICGDVRLHVNSAMAAAVFREPVNDATHTPAYLPLRLDFISISLCAACIKCTHSASGKLD
jgi:hypothetical protein